MKRSFTKLQLVLEIITILILIGMYAYLFLKWSTIPDQIPGHYNAAGEIDRWGNKSELITLPILSTILYLLLTAVLLFPSLWNLPGKVTENNINEMYSNVRYLLVIMKLLIMALFFYIMYNGTKAQALPPVFLPIVLVIIFGTTAISMIKIVKASHIV
jgi:uncharacterized membrane protein